MPVDPNDIMIFKARGMTSKAKAKPAKPQPQQAQQPLPQAEVKQVQKPQPQLAQAQQAQIKAQPKAGMQPERPKEMSEYEKELERAKEIEEEVRQKLLEQEIETPIEVSAPQPSNEIITANPFSKIAGLLLLADSLLFGFFTYPQYIFLLSNLFKPGTSFFSSFNYSYGIALLNLMVFLVLLLAGASMLRLRKLSFTFSGSAGIAMLLVSSFEYLSSNATYFVVVAAVTFISLVAVAYSRMSAVIEPQETETSPEEISWPRIETF